MDKVLLIVPVASFEPLSVLKKSVACMHALKRDGLDVHITYVLDLTGDDDPRMEFFRDAPSGTVVISRRTNSGRRAGAINAALNTRCISPDYIALFDVDSRPHQNFLIECVKALKMNESAIIASSARFVTNESENIVTRTIAAEYLFFSDVYRLFAKYDGFTHFNGLIGVLNAKLMADDRFSRLNESVPCEDVEFTQKAYLASLTSVFVPGTMVGEQAPCTIDDLFNQRTRWLSGAYQGLRKHLSSFLSSEIPGSRRLSWFLSLSLPFVAVLLMPFVPLYGLRLCVRYKIVPAITPTIGLLGHVCLITTCGLVVLTKQLSDRGIDWKDSRRSDV